MKKLRKNISSKTIVRLLALSLSCGGQVVLAADQGGLIEESTFSLGGYARGWASVNLQDQPETPNAKGKLSMLRGSLMLDADWKPTNTMRFKAIARVDQEYKTDYLRALEAGPSGSPGNGSIKDVFTTQGGGGIGGVMNNYNQGELRELWGEYELSDNIKLKVGKQQVVWGETDFFHAMDIVHGFDYRWRSFLEVEGEELRKPLNLARIMIQVPAAKGSIDAFIRPGLDSNGAIGNTYDLAGGRWASQPSRGASFLYATNYNYHSAGANQNDVTGGIRWQGQAADINYSVALLNTFNTDPVFNPCPATMALLYGSPAPFKSFKQTPKTCGFSNNNPLQPGGIQPLFGDWVFPTTNVLGFTASGYSAATDAVFSTEIVYQKDRSFNYGYDNGKFGANIVPGSFGIIQKNTLTTMFRMDKTVNLTQIIGTSRPSFASVQLFNTRILNYDKNDEIVQLAYWSRPRKQNSALLTGILAMNYKNDLINPSIAAGWDVTYGGGFFIPSIEFVFGDKWRVKAELDLFFNQGNEKVRYLNPATFAYEEKGRGAALMGYFGGANQAVIRVTRQF